MRSEELHEALRKKLVHEVQHIDELLESFAPLLGATHVREPDLVELSALATVLHSFYGGVENIFTMIAKNLDHRMPTGTKWHKDLLDQMAIATESRTTIVGGTLRGKLTDYLSFRHFFRNSYAYQLDWDQLRPLVGSLKQTWTELKKSLQTAMDLDHVETEDPV